MPALSSKVWAWACIGAALIVIALPKDPRRNAPRRLPTALSTDLDSLLREHAQDPLSFELELRRQLQQTPHATEVIALAQAALELSPLEMPRAFATDGTASAWDLALTIAMREWTLAEPQATARFERALHDLRDPQSSPASLCAALRECLHAANQEAALAQLLFVAASRFASTNPNHDCIAELTELALIEAQQPHSKVLLALAVIQLDLSAHAQELRFSSRAAWSTLHAICPETWRMRAALARGLDFLRRGDADLRREAQQDLAAWLQRHPDAPLDLRALAVEACLRDLLSGAESASIEALLRALPKHFSTTSETAAALVLAVHATTNDADRSLREVPLLQEALTSIASDESLMDVCIAARVVLAEHAARQGRDVEARERWSSAAELAATAKIEQINGTAAPISATRAWRIWDHFGAPPLLTLRRARLGQHALWIHAREALSQQDWKRALACLERLDSAPNATSATDATADLERRHLNAQCLEHLGRIEEARALRIATVQRPYHDVAARSEALFAWIDFELGRGEIERVQPSSQSAQIPAELVERAQLYIQWWRAAHMRSREARQLQTEIEQRFATDPALLRRVR